MKSRIAAIFVLFLSATAALGQTYHFTDLGSLGGPNTFPTAINNLGQVVGYSQTGPGFSNNHAFLYSNGTMSDLGILDPAGGGESFAYAINDSGIVVGNSSLQSLFGSYKPCLFQNGTVVDLNPLRPFGGGSNTAAYGINNSNQIVGWDFFESPQATSATDFAALQYATATAINDAGQVAGYTNPSFTPKHAFLYSGGVMTDLGTLGGSASFAYNISANGDVRGTSEIDAQGHQHGFLYHNGVMTDLSLLGIDGASASNSKGQFVGGGFFHDDGSGTMISGTYVYDGQAFKALSDIVDSSADGWDMSNAIAINNSGWIIGTAYDANGSRFGSNEAHAFLLTPVPEPSTIVLAALGFAGSFWRMTHQSRGKARRTATSN